MKKYRLLLILIVIVLAIIFYPGGNDDNARVWRATGSEGLIIGGYGDNFAYDGIGVREVDGAFSLDVDTDSNTGHVTVTLPYATHQTSKATSLDGEIKIVLKFDGDHHSIFNTNKVLAHDEEEDEPEAMHHADSLMPFMQGGIAEQLYLHGDSGQGPPVMPKVWTYVAGWGDLDIYVDGEVVYEDMDGHFMVTEQARRDEKIVNENGVPYSPARAAESGFTNPLGTELHIVGHSHTPDTGNFPPHSDWIHLNFQKVNWLKTPAGTTLSVPQ